MADVLKYSTTEPNMIDIPMGMQAPAGETAYPYSVNAWRYLMRGYRATAPRGVSSGSDFVVTPGAGRSVDISTGLGVTYHPDNIQERYVFGTFGAVNLEMPAHTGGTNYHLLGAYTIDKQIPPGTTGTSQWAFRMFEGTGGVIPIPAVHTVVPLTLVRDTGQVNVTAADLTDQRSPFDNTAPTCALTRTASMSVPNDGARHAIHFTAQEDDPYNLWKPGVDTDVAVFIRHPGTYNMMLRADFPGVVATSTVATLMIGVGGLTDTLVYNSIVGSSQGTTVTAVLLNQKIIPDPGYYLMCGASQTAASAVITNVKFRVQRVEYRAS